MARIKVIETPDGKLGPLLGPFTLELAQGEGEDEGDVIGVLVAYMRTVVNGMSAYNKNDWEESSLLNSYAVECFEELKGDEPDLAAALENLTVDLSTLGDDVRKHPIWKLDRAILRTLPGIAFIE
jgi:hypothetical protein